MADVIAFGYNGNTKSKTDSTGTTSYTWDFENRLTSVTLPGTGGTVSFKYDPFGRRIQKSVTTGANPPTTTITNYVYDGNNLVEEVDPNGNVLARYEQTQNIDEPLAMWRSGTTSYYHADGLGSVTSLSNSAGALAQTYTFDSFGKQTASSGATTNLFRYTAREFDNETGLYFLRARYFDPNTGRFLGEDPLGLAGGINFYGYAGNSPSNFKDPFGLAYTTYQSVVDLGIYVNASITLYGPGANDALAAAWQRAIIDTWNKNPGFGKCKVFFNVQVIADPNTRDRQHARFPLGFRGANNYIFVPAGSPADLGNPRVNPDMYTGTIPSGTLSYTVAHEFGHLLHMYDTNIYGYNISPWRPKNDIMNEGDIVSQYDIKQIIDGGKAPCGCK